MVSEYPFIITASGIKFTFTDPQPEQISIDDIAHSLSMICRFNGHVSSFYSVADHCIRCSQIVPPDLALEGLLHDAAEAYIGDLILPLKRGMPQYKDIETRIEWAIAERFGLKYPWPPEIKEADHVLVLTEARDLTCHEGPDLWELNYEWQKLCLEEEILPRAPGRAKEDFLKRYYELSNPRKPKELLENQRANQDAEDR